MQKPFYTVVEFVEKFGAQYGINSTEYAQKCCAEKTIKLANNKTFTHKLPPGWIATKLPGSGRGTWIIQRENPESFPDI